METSRKRHLEDDEIVASKKRVTSSGQVQVQVNGRDANEVEVPTDENLEFFRKGAIYRRMKHYARSYERAEQAIADLEKTRTTYAAGIAALEACWTLLVEKLRSLVSNSGAATNPPSEPNLYELVLGDFLDDELSLALQKRSQEMDMLLEAAKLPTEASSPSGLANNCENLQVENMAMRAQINVLRTKLSQSESVCEKVQERLDKAESRLDRTLSEVPRTRSPSSPARFSEAEEIIKLEPRLSDRPDSPSLSSRIPDEIADLRTALEFKESQIKELTEEMTQLSAANRGLKEKCIDPSEDMLLRSTAYRTLQDQASVSAARLNELNEKVKSLQAEHDELLASRLEFEEQHKVEARARAEEFKMQLAKRDVDLNRIRENRDTLQAELHDKKILMQAQSDGQRLAKNLANTRYERIKTLNKEVARLRQRLAAQAGDEDLVEFLLREGDSEMALPENIIRVNRELRARLEATEDVLSQTANPTDLRLKVHEKAIIVDLETRLRKYESSCSTSQEPHEMASRLNSQGEELKRCKLIMEAKEQEILSQQTALDQLAAAWETLNDKVEAKIVETSVIEEKVNKMASEKAKAENKYFATMRIKDQLDLEKKAISRTLEKQSKMLERFMENEGTLKAQLANQTKELSQHDGTIFECRQTVTQLETGMKRLHYQKETLEAKLSDLSRTVSVQESELHEKLQSKRKIEEELSLCKKEVERLKGKASLSNSTGDKATLMKLDNCMRLLTCSTCKENFRDTLLSKCLHTFCHHCIDARISTRQRKCPACNMAFSTSDVQQLFFQG